MQQINSVDIQQEIYFVGFIRSKFDIIMMPAVFRLPSLVESTNSELDCRRTGDFFIEFDGSKLFHSTLTTISYSSVYEVVRSEAFLLFIFD